MGWLSGWLYRKSVTLSRSAGAVDDYQMRILVGQSAGAGGADVHCHGNVRSDFNDLRFTTSDGTTLLNYWIESITGSAPDRLATVWVKFNWIGTSATTFYMYYGKSDASAFSDPDATLIYYHDFEEDTVGQPPSKFISSSNLTVVSDSGGQGTKAVCNTTDTTNTFSESGTLRTNTRVICRVRWNSGPYNRHVIFTRFVDGNNLVQVGGVATNQINIFEKIGGAFFNRASASFTWGTSWHTMEIRTVGTSCTAIVGATQISFNSLTITGTNQGRQLSLWAGSINSYDYIRIFRLESPEPAWGTWGSQEEEPPPQGGVIMVLFD